LNPPTDNEAAARAAVVAEARAWLGTPYHHAAQVKGAGVDCAMLPAAVYRAAGLIPEFEIAHYPPDWHLHRDTERYLEMVTHHATEVPVPTGPGDFVLYRFGRAFAHGAIVIDWPTIVHAVMRVGVVLDLADAGRLNGRERRFFTLWPQPQNQPPTPPEAASAVYNALWACRAARTNPRVSHAGGRPRPAFEGTTLP
jgi:cell wall-associated NlpC family hydrolase